MIRKDVIFAITASLWLGSNITAYIIYGGFGHAISNIICLLLFCVMLAFKQNNKRFGNWLEEKAKKTKKID